MSGWPAGWTVHPHGALTQRADNLWTIEGQVPSLRLNRVSTIVRQPDGGLLLHNAIAVSEEAAAAIEALGRPSVLMVPGGYHRIDPAALKHRWPALRVVCPAGARARVAAVVPVDAVYPYADGPVHVDHLDGTSAREGVMTVRSTDGVTLAFNDVVFNLPDHLGGLVGFLFRYVTASSKGPRVTRLAKRFVVSDRSALRAHLERLAATPDLTRVVIMHGESAWEGRRGAEILREAARTL